MYDFLFLRFFFFKQKTAYEMRISDWSSDVCSSDLPHDIKGQGIYAYVTLKAGIQPTEELRKELVAHVRQQIGPIASPDLIQWAPGLPKTRSGKKIGRAHV